MAGSLTISGTAAGLLGGQNVIGPQTMTGTAVVGTRTDLTLSSGDNTITVPAGAVAIYIVLPATNTVTLKIRTNLNSTDGGMQIGLTGFVAFSFPSGTTSVIINAASSAGAIEATFI